MQLQVGKNGGKHSKLGEKKVSARLIELAEITSGQKILDIATGIGEPAVTAARKLVAGSTGSTKNNNNYDNTNNRGHVLATDISSQMLKIAKQRAAATGLQAEWSRISWK